MSHQVMLALVLLLPLLGAVLNGFVLRRVPRAVNVLVGTLAVAVPFVLSCILVFGPVSAGEIVRTDLFDWVAIQLNDSSVFRIPFGLVADRLSAVLMLVITGVGSLIHLYAGEYMSKEKGVYRFFAYLNLFVFAMLSLVLGSNMLVTFLGWEGVGLCSYLLIGYWYEDNANARAGMKAFVVNRVGDLGFLIAMFMTVILFGTLEYSDLALQISRLSPEWFVENSISLTVIGLCLLLGVSGKSAQLPLFTWLPDAMAGPTPVSALIHAATMVTSGIYLMTRLSFLLVHSPTTMFAIALVGGLTAFFAATIGLVQNDIKKVLAYSTISQLGYMVMACGVGAFHYGVAHLTTHAFFKALLFLGAGSVIHAMHHEQDIRKMGGLIRKMPVTGWTFVIGTLAIIGFPPFSGFFSKDEILFSAWAAPYGMPLFWGLGILGAACTSFYMVRLTVLVFFGSNRSEPEVASHIHENSASMTIPLVLLAILSTVGGLIAVPHIFTHTDNRITVWLSPVLEQAKATMDVLRPAAETSPALEWGLMGVSTLVMLVFAGTAVALYLRKGPAGGEAIAKSAGDLYTLVLDKWRVDELYEFLFVRPVKKLGEILYKVADRFVIDGCVNDAPRIIHIFTTVVSDSQSGMARTYLKTLFGGIVIIVLLLSLFLV